MTSGQTGSSVSILWRDLTAGPLRALGGRTEGDLSQRGGREAIAGYSTGPAPGADRRGEQAAPFSVAVRLPLPLCAAAGQPTRSAAAGRPHPLSRGGGQRPL